MLRMSERGEMQEDHQKLSTELSTMVDNLHPRCQCQRLALLALIGTYKLFFFHIVSLSLCLRPLPDST